MLGFHTTIPYYVSSDMLATLIKYVLFVAAVLLKAVLIYLCGHLNGTACDNVLMSFAEYWYQENTIETIRSSRSLLLAISGVIAILLHIILVRVVLIMLCGETNACDTSHARTHADARAQERVVEKEEEFVPFSDRAGTSFLPLPPRSHRPPQIVSSMATLNIGRMNSCFNQFHFSYVPPSMPSDDIKKNEGTMQMLRDESVLKNLEMDSEDESD